jgi:putative ABC transport system permease protein
MLESLWQDIRFGVRQLAVDRGFSVAALVTLALGIGACATLLAVAQAVVLARLPYPEPERLVLLQGSAVDEATGQTTSWSISLMDFADWRARTSAFSEMAAWTGLAVNLEQGERSQRLLGELVNQSYFPLLGLEPAAGRFFAPDEDARPMEQWVVVLGYDLWRRSFGADPAVVGSQLQLNGRSYQVVGVAPAGFRGLTDQADLWVPSMLPPIADYLTQRSFRSVSGVARLAPGVSLRQAAEQLGVVTAALAAEFPDSNKGFGATVAPLGDLWFGGLRKRLPLIGLGAGILLLVACINVASLQLTRAAARQRAWSIRIALGASRPRLIRQLLVENLVLSVVGAVAGLVLAHWASRALLAASGTVLPSFVAVGAGPRVIAASIGLALLCGLAFGLAPIASSFRADLSRNLGRDDKREVPAKGWPRFQSVVVVAQVALVLVLAVDAVLMARGFRALVGQDLGFRQEGLLTFRTDLRGPKYLDAAVAGARLRQEYLPRIAAVPGVRTLAMASPTMPTDGWVGGSITIEDHASDRADGTYTAILRSVTPEFFAVLGIPLRKGRPFNLQDTQSAAVIVSQALADQQWPGEDPLGKRLKTGPRTNSNTPWLTVVGVAADVRYEGLAGDKPTSIFRCFSSCAAR